MARRKVSFRSFLPFAASDGDRHTIDNDLLGGGRNRHQARAALPVNRHARHADRKASPQRRLPGDIEARAALLERATHHDIVDFRRIDTGSLDCRADRVRRQSLALRIVETAPISAPDRRARNGDDDGCPHGYGLPIDYDRDDGQPSPSVASVSIRCEGAGRSLPSAANFRRCPGIMPKPCCSAQCIGPPRWRGKP